MKPIFTRLNDGFDDNELLDVQGHRFEMAPEERAAIEEKEYESALLRVQQENQRFLAFGGTL